MDNWPMSGNGCPARVRSVDSNRTPCPMWPFTPIKQSLSLLWNDGLLIACERSYLLFTSLLMFTVVKKYVNCHMNNYLRKFPLLTQCMILLKDFSYLELQSWIKTKFQKITKGQNWVEFITLCQKSSKWKLLKLEIN